MRLFIIASAVLNGSGGRDAFCLDPDLRDRPRAFHHGGDGPRFSGMPFTCSQLAESFRQERMLDCVDCCFCLHQNDHHSFSFLVL